MVEDRSGKVSKGPPVRSGALSCLHACMSLISLRPEGGRREKKKSEKIKDVRFEGNEGRRGEVGEGEGEEEEEEEEGESVAIAVR